MKKIINIYTQGKGIIFLILGIAITILSYIKMSDFIRDMHSDGNNVFSLIGMGIAMFGCGIGFILYPIWDVIKEIIKK